MVFVVISSAHAFAANAMNALNASSIASSDHANVATFKSMHGIQLSDYGDFEKNWHLVTVRFTYANDSAWSQLKSVTQKNAAQKNAALGSSTSAAAASKNNRAM